MKRLMVMACIVMVCCVGSIAKADLFLELSSPDDLMNLMIGDTATIDVSLTGLLSGEQLVSLTSSVLFPSGPLGTPLSISSGDIIPNASDFLSFAGAGQADGAFLTFIDDPADHIVGDGVFYSFAIQVQAVGSGAFSLDPLALGAEQYNPTDPFWPILRDVQAGPDLPFNVVPDFPAVYLAAIGLALAGKKLRAAIR